MRHAMLTTIDNPFNPFERFDDWFNYDRDKGYDSCQYLARIAVTSDELSEVDQALAVERAVDEIVDMNVLGLYKKVVTETEDLYETK
jgi:hypothetical protein